ncbi:hypothetical protein ACJX0J_013011, partial [Zea mays]
VLYFFPLEDAVLHAKYFHICYTSPMFTYQGQEHFKPFPLISEIKVIFGGPPLAHRKQAAYVPGSLSLSSILGNCLLFFVTSDYLFVLYFFPLEDAVLHAKYFHICYTSPMFAFSLMKMNGKELFALMFITFFDNALWTYMLIIILSHMFIFQDMASNNILLEQTLPLHDSLFYFIVYYL